MADKRLGRVQPIKLSPKFYPLDIHKSMFINDMMISLPQYYAESWGTATLSTHKNKQTWEVHCSYIYPKELGRKKEKFSVKLSLSDAKGRNQTSRYRLKWKKDFAVRLAKDYPKSFVRALEFHIGDEYYKEIKFTEFDIGGFKEQLQVKIEWKNDKPEITIKELFRVRAEQQGFPEVYNKLSSYLIADYLLGSKEEILRRIQVENWKPRSEISKELNENNIYLLLNRKTQEIYFGETKLSLSKRYPLNQMHHSFDDWDEYSIIQLPPETSDHTRLLIERVLIAVGAKLFDNTLYSGKPALAKDVGLVLKNRKK
ncbi:hypothetical protein N9M10_02255 [Hellea sp.]|nr:hypothetical protein [Hellea sp.]